MPLSNSLHTHTQARISFVVSLTDREREREVEEGSSGEGGLSVN